MTETAGQGGCGTLTAWNDRAPNTERLDAMAPALHYLFPLRGTDMRQQAMGDWSQQGLVAATPTLGSEPIVPLVCGLSSVICRPWSLNRQPSTVNCELGWHRRVGAAARASRAHA